MPWPVAIEQIISVLRADAELQSLLGPDYPNRIKRSSTGPAEFNSVTWAMIADLEDENEEVLAIQWDIWAVGAPGSSGAYAVAAAIETRLRALMNYQAQVVTIGSARMFSRVTDARDVEDPEDGVSHRAIDFEYKIARAVNIA